MKWTQPYQSLFERLMFLTVEENGCWIWLGARTADGYGKMPMWDKVTKKNRRLFAHRVSYELFIGPIPLDHDLDHGRHCKNRACIHPNHLTPVEWRTHRRGTAFAKANPPKVTR